MKKTIIFLLTLVLFAGMTICVHAAQDSLQITPAFNEDGDTVYLTVSLTESLQGNTLGLTYDYNKKELSADKEGFIWLKKGILADFRADKNQGAWTCSDQMDLSGDICVLAFRLPEGFTKSEIKVTLLVKNHAQVLGEYQASTVVSLSCTHTFGSWSDNGPVGHVRSCESCGETRTESHSWDAGITEPDPDDPGYQIRTRTCTICRGTQTERIPASAQTQAPTVPTQPEPNQTQPTQPTSPSEPAETEATQPVTVPAPEETSPEIAKPSDPTEPSQAPTQPTQPPPSTHPTAPQEPPTAPTGPTESTQATHSTSPTHPTQAEQEDFNAPPASTAVDEDHAHNHSSDPVPTGDPSVQTPIPTLPVPDLGGMETAPSVPSTEASSQHDGDEAASGAPIFAVAGLALLACAGIWLYRKKRS